MNMQTVERNTHGVEGAGEAAAEAGSFRSFLSLDLTSKTLSLNTMSFSSILGIEPRGWSFALQLLRRRPKHSKLSGELRLIQTAQSSDVRGAALVHVGPASWNNVIARLACRSYSRTEDLVSRDPRAGSRNDHRKSACDSCVF
jgi:hypothetical protein